MRIPITSLLLLYWTTLASCAVKSLLQPINDCDSQVSLFKDGKTYYYSYDLESTAVSDKNEERFLLDIKCDVQLDAIGKCQYVLNTKDCRLFKEHNVLHEQSRTFSKQMEKNPVLFTMSQDNVSSMSVSEDEDKAWLNIKRGIIGTFQTVQVNQLKDQFQKKRNDVQGICDVYLELELQRTVKSRKPLSNCTLNDGHLVYGVEECRHHFNDVDDIYNVSCIEQPSHMYRFSSFSPRFRRSLSLVKSASLLEQTASYLNNYRMININFEYPDPPKSNPPNVKKTVITLIERMIELSHSPIESESLWLFNDLVEILRSSINLESLSSGIDDCWGSPKCHSAKTSSADRYRIHFGHIWRDALIQCGSTACLKAFKSYVTERTASMADVLSDEIMEDIYYEWLIDGSTDLESIYSIFDVCHFKNQSLCYLALSSNIHRYWKLNSNISTIPKKLKVIVEKTVEPIKNCDNATVANWRLLLSLKMLSNIGELAEVVEPDLINILQGCATKSTTDWMSSSVAVEAFRRMQPSSKLYEHLLNIIRNPSLKQEGRVNAYLILVDKWSEKAANDIDAILKSEAIDDNIKTFIYSHIKAVLRAQDHARVRLAEAFRKIVDNNTLEYFSYNSDEKLVSKYIENGLFFMPSLLGIKAGRYGFQSTETSFYDGTSFLPSSLMNKLKLTMEDKVFDFTEVSIYSKGIVNILTLFLQNIIDNNYSVEDSSSRLTSWLSSQLKNSKSKFLLDKLDIKIAQKLENIINKLSESFNTKPSALINMKTFGEESEYADYSALLSDLLKSMKEPLNKSTHLRKNVELYKKSVALVTSGGLPLKFFNVIDLMIVTNSKHFDHESNKAETSVVRFSSNINSSFAIVAETGSIVDFPGFIRKGYGDEYFASVSGAVVADVSLDMSKDGKKTVRLELPANSKQAVVFSKQYVSIEDNKRQLSFANKEKETDCYDFIRLCRTRLYEDEAFPQQFYDKWDLQIRDKHPAVLLFKYIAKDNETTTSNHFSLSASSEGVETFRQLLYYNHVLDKPEKIERANIGTDLLPNFKLEAIYKSLSSDETTIQYRGSFTHGFGFHYHSKTSVSRFTEDRFKYTRYRQVKSDESGKLYVHNFDLSTPKGNLTIVYAKQQFPVSDYYDVLFQIKCIDTDAADGLRSTIQMPFIWEDSRTIKMNMHEEMESNLDNFETGVPEDRTYTAFIFPKYKIELESQSSIVDEHSVLSTLNLTSHSLPDNTPEVSYKLSLFETTVKDEFNVTTNKIVATFSVPHLKWIFSFDRHDSLKRSGIVLKAQRRVNEDDASGQLSKSLYYQILSDSPPSNQEISFDSEFGRNIEDRGFYMLANFNFTGFQWLNTKSDPLGNIQFKLRSYDVQNHATYSLRSTHHDRALYGEIDIGRNLYHKLDLVDKANATISQLMINSSISFLYTNHFHFIHNFSSDVYTYLSQLNVPLNGWNNVTVDYSIMAHSPEWNLLNVDLKDHVANGYETLKMKHDLLDIEGEGTCRVDGYKNTVTFNSKTDWIPSMRWKLNCESIYKCVAQGTFIKSKTASVFIVSELSPGKTELAFTICRNKICQDILSDPDDFVLKTVFSLIEPFTIVRTITVDPRLIGQLDASLSKAFQNVFRNAEMILLNLNHPLHKIYRHFMGISTEETFSRLLQNGAAITELLAPDAVVIVGPVISVLSYCIGPASLVYRSLHLQYVGRAVELYSLVARVHNTYSFTSQILSRRPGPYPGYSSVVDFHLPLAVKPTTSWKSIQFRPKSFNVWNELRNDKHVIHDVFYDEKFSRVALLIGNDAVRPFEGGLFKIHQPHCPQLLALDVEEQLFIVYKQNDWLHLILSDTHLEISYTEGQFIVNSSQHEFPYEHWTREFSVIREGDLIILDTAYHLKIVCDVGDHYCVFYTDIWKFGKFYGLLGNNTDAVLAQQSKISAQDYLSSFTLTDQSNCAATNSQEYRFKSGTDADIGLPKALGCKSFNYWQPDYLTFICHDKIDPAPYFEVCREQGRRSVTKAYLAACGALNVPVNLGFPWDYKCDGDHGVYYIDREWREFRDRKSVDVVFIVDQSLDSKNGRSYSKGLSNLAENIKNEFVRNSYSEIRFALFGLRGPGAFIVPTVYTTKNHIWGSAEDFSSKTLSYLFSMKPSNESKNGSSDLIDALRLALDTALLASRPARIIVLVTPQDPFDHIEVEYLYGLLESLNSRQTTLYTISNYKELPKGAFGIVGNQLSKPKNLKTRVPAPPSGFNDLVQGHAARLAMATKGALWSLSHLESGYDENQKEFFSEVSGAMVNRAQQFLNRYYQCKCIAPDLSKPYSSCEVV